MLECNFLVIGAGESGLILAQELTKIGHSVILVEQGEVGGSYLFSNEIPKYFLSQKAKDFATTLKQFKDYRETFSILLKQRLKIQMHLNEHIKQYKITLENKLTNLPKLKIIHGTAEFTSKKLVEINSQFERHLVSFDKAILTNGKGLMTIPKIKGIADVDFLFQHNVFLFQHIPSKMAIIGVTPENLEIANIYSNLGIKITIFDSQDSSKVIPGLDSTALNFIIKELSSKQVEFYFKTHILKIKKQDKDLILCSSDKKEFVFSHIYISVKETFDAKTLKLSKLNIKNSELGILSNNNGNTDHKHIYTFGEASSKTNKKNKHVNIQNFIKTQKIKEDKKLTGINLLSNISILNKDIVSLKSDTVKIKLDYFVTTIGLTETIAIEKFGSQVKSKFIESKEIYGFLKLVYKEKSGKVLGITLAGEIANQLESVMIYRFQKNCLYSDLRNFVISYLGI